MRDELVDLLERVRIEQSLHPLASGQLALFVLFAQPLLPAPELGSAFEILKFV
jgi:hypothetical protein